MAKKVKMLERYMKNNRLEQENKSHLERIADSFRDFGRKTGNFARKAPVYAGIGAMLFGASAGLISPGRNEQYHARPPTQTKQEQSELKYQTMPVAIAQEQSTELERKVDENKKEYRGNIAFVCDREGERHTESYLGIINQDGSDKKILAFMKNGSSTSKEWSPWFSWSPDGSKIAFVSDRDGFVLGRDGNDEIYVMNADGTGQTNLTNNPAWDRGGLSWTPNGKKIAFVSDRDGNNEIYVMNADGTEQRNLTNSPTEDLGPKWSPDGSKIVFTSERDENPPEIYVMNADSGNKRLLGNGGSPVWLPNGTQIIAFVDYGVSIIDIENGKRREIVGIDTKFPDEVMLGPKTWIPDFCLSPDGKRIAVTTFTEGGKGNILYTMNTDGSDIRKMTRYFTNDDYLSWSPDGSKIAFCDGNIWLVDIKRRIKRILTKGDYNYCPSWQPMPK